MLHLALAGMAVFATEVIDVVKIILVLYDGLGIEQWLTVLTLRGARLKFKKYSVCLTWHNRFVQIRKKKSPTILLIELLRAEGEGFKPPIPERGIPDFESSAIDHSANLPSKSDAKVLNSEQNTK